MIWPNSIWNTLDVDKEAFKKRIERATGLTVRGWCHGNKPEFDPDVAVDMELVQDLASGREVPSSASPVVRKTAKPVPVHTKKTRRGKKP